MAKYKKETVIFAVPQQFEVDCLPVCKFIQLKLNILAMYIVHVVRHCLHHRLESRL